MAVTLEELQVKFTAEMGGLNSQLNGIKQQLGGVEGASQKTASKLGAMAKAGIAFAGVMVGRALVNVGQEALLMANDVTESESLFAVSMGDMADSTREWSKQLSSSLGVSEYAARKNVGVLNTMFKSMGLGKESAADMSMNMVELANDMASFYNLPVEDAFQKLQAGITGEAEPLKRLGILIDEATIQSYALRKGIIKQGQTMTAQQKVAARYGAIIEQTGDAQGDLARTMDSPTNQLRRLNTEMDNAKIALGQALQPALIAVLPVLTGFAQGVAGVIQSLSGMNKEGRDSFSGVALSLDEARVIVGKSVDRSTIELVDKIEKLDEAVDKALDDYESAETLVKKVAMQIELDPPTTTGEQRITDELNRLKGLVPVEIDTTPITTKLDVITEDGTVTEKEEKSMEKLLNSWSAKTIKEIKIDEKNKLKEIDALLKAGEITELKAGEMKLAVTTAAEAAIGEVTATVTAVKAEVGAGGDSLTAVSFSPEQAVRLGEAISKAANAQEIAVSAEVDRVEATWAGEGEIGDTVSGIYTDIETAFNTKNAELKAIAEKMLSGVATDQMWKDAIRLKEELRQITAFMFEDNGKLGAIFSGETNLSESGLGNMFKAYNEYITEESTKTKELLNTKIGDIMSLPADVFEKEFPGKTPADIIAELRTNAEAELSADKTAALTAMAADLIPSIVAAVSSGEMSLSELIGLFNLFTQSLQGIDLSALPEEAKTAVSDMLNAFNSPETQELLGPDNFIQAMVDGWIEKLGIGASEATTKGEESGQNYADGITSKDEEVSLAALGLAGSATDGLKTDTTSSGENFGQGFVNGIKSKVDDAKRSAEELANAAWNSLKNTNEEESPAKRPMRSGVNFSKGFANGIINSANLASRAAAGLANGAINALNSPSISTMTPSQSVSAPIQGAFSQGNTTLELVVDGEKLGKVAIKNINDIQRRTGRAILNLGG